MNKIELKKNIMDYAAKRNKPFCADNLIKHLGLKLSIALRKEIMGVCAKLERQGKLVLTKPSNYCIVTSDEEIREPNSFDIARRNNGEYARSFNIRI